MQRAASGKQGTKQKQTMNDLKKRDWFCGSRFRHLSRKDTQEKSPTFRQKTNTHTSSSQASQFQHFRFCFFQTAHVCRGKRQDANLNRKTKIHFQDKVIALYQAGSRTTRVINT